MFFLIHVSICNDSIISLGPADFHPQTPNCPEETLTREYVQNGYKETVEGLEVRCHNHLCSLPFSSGGMQV